MVEKRSGKPSVGSLRDYSSAGKQRNLRSDLNFSHELPIDSLCNPPFPIHLTENRGLPNLPDSAPWPSG